MVEFDTLIYRSTRLNTIILQLLTFYGSKDKPIDKSVQPKLSNIHLSIRQRSNMFLGDFRGFVKKTPEGRVIPEEKHASVIFNQIDLSYTYVYVCKLCTFALCGMCISYYTCE